MLWISNILCLKKLGHVLSLVKQYGGHGNNFIYEFQPPLIIYIMWPLDRIGVFTGGYIFKGSHFVAPNKKVHCYIRRYVLKNIDVIS